MASIIGLFGAMCTRTIGQEQARFDATKIPEKKRSCHRQRKFNSYVNTSSNDNSADKDPSFRNLSGKQLLASLPVFLVSGVALGMVILCNTHPTHTSFQVVYYKLGFIQTNKGRPRQTSAWQRNEAHSQIVVAVIFRERNF